MQLDYTRTLDPDVDLDADIIAALNARAAALNALPDADPDNLATPATILAEVVNDVLSTWAKQHTDSIVDTKADMIKAGPRALRLQLDALVDSVLGQ
jgi:hypothetical protein